MRGLRSQCPHFQKASPFPYNFIDLQAPDYSQGKRQKQMKVDELDKACNVFINTHTSSPHLHIKYLINQNECVYLDSIQNSQSTRDMQILVHAHLRNGNNYEIILRSELKHDQACLEYTGVLSVISLAQKANYRTFIDCPSRREH